MTIHVAVVDDHPTCVEGVVALLANDPRFKCVLSTTKAGELLAFVDAGGVADVVVLDLRMPEVDGWDLLAGLGDRRRAPRAVVLSALSDLDAILDAKSLGAAAFILKSEANQCLLDEIEWASRHEGFHTDPETQRALDARAAERNCLASTPSDPLKQLTLREFEVFRLIPAHFGGAKEIGVRLGISSSTVEKHLASIRRKLAMNSHELLRYSLSRVWRSAP